jgi:hypothetical protein
MSKRQELHVYDYVNHPYASVRDALLRDPRGIFERATTTAAARAHALGAAIHVKLGPIDVVAEVAIHVVSIDEVASPLGQPGTRLLFDWKSTNRPGLFPTMKGTLLVYALTSTETQLEFSGVYDPPMGVVGDAIDALILHRVVAQASVQHFVQDVAAYLRTGVNAPARPVSSNPPRPLESVVTK